MLIEKNLNLHCSKTNFS